MGYSIKVKNFAHCSFEDSIEFLVVGLTNCCVMTIVGLTCEVG